MNSAPRPNRSAVESAPLAPDAPDEGRWRARFVFAGKSLVNVSFVAVLVVGALRLTDKAREAPRHQVDLDRWAVLQRPAWSRLSDVEAVRAHSDLPGRTVSVLDRKALGAIRDRLEASPIVLRVHEVRRRLPGRVEVVAELRVPVAAVEVPRDGAADLRSFVEVDRDATSLGPPSAERPWRRGRPLRLVRGVHGPVPAAGGRWGPDARAGAELCAHLDQVLPELRGLGDGFLDVVDVSNLAGRLDRGPRSWGSRTSRRSSVASAKRCASFPAWRGSRASTSLSKS